MPMVRHSSMWTTTLSVFAISDVRSGHELHRVVRLEVRRLVRHDPVGRRVGLVEAVARELLHQLEDALGDLLLDAAPLGTGEELGALLGHERRDLLAHRLRRSSASLIEKPAMSARS